MRDNILIRVLFDGDPYFFWKTMKKFALALVTVLSMTMFCSCDGLLFGALLLGESIMYEDEPDFSFFECDVDIQCISDSVAPDGQRQHIMLCSGYLSGYEGEVSLEIDNHGLKKDFTMTGARMPFSFTFLQADARPGNPITYNINIVTDYKGKHYDIIQTSLVVLPH